MLSTPADFLFLLQPPLLCEGLDGHLQSLSEDSPVLMDLHWPCDYTAQCSIPSIDSVSLVLLWGIFLNYVGRSSFSLFHSGQVFHKLVCPLTVRPQGTNTRNGQVQREHPWAL